jgi:hypothetical protein
MHNNCSLMKQVLFLYTNLHVIQGLYIGQALWPLDNRELALSQGYAHLLVILFRCSILP